MKLIRILSNVMEFVSYGVLRVFSPQKDDYPVVGAIAYTGQTNQNKAKHKKHHH